MGGFSVVPSGVAGPTNPQLAVQKLIDQLMAQRQASSPQQTGLTADAQPYRGYDAGGQVTSDQLPLPSLPQMMPQLNAPSSYTPSFGQRFAANYGKNQQPVDWSGTTGPWSGRAAGGPVAAPPAGPQSFGTMARRPEDYRGLAGGQWQGYAKGGDVRGHGHDTGDPHLDNALDEVYDTMSGNHPDPHGAMMNYADALMPGSMDDMQSQGGGQPAGPSMADLLMGPQGGDQGEPDGDEGQGGQGDQDGDEGQAGQAGPYEGIVKGEGGGMDDSIPAQSDDGTQIQLSNGEFVIPADVVAALGDGSTDAGAQKLYQFIDQFRQMKQGSPDQPGQTPDDVFDSLSPGGDDGDEGQGMPPGSPQQGAPPQGPPMPPDPNQPPMPGMASGGWVKGRW